MLVYNARKLTATKEAARQAHTVASDLRDRIRQLQIEIRNVRAPVDAPGSDQKPDNQQIKRVNEKAKPLENDLAFYQDELRRVENNRQALGPVAERCEVWLREQNSEQRVEADPNAKPPEPVRDRDKAQKKVEQLGDKIADALSRRDAIEAAPLSAEEIKARIHEFLDREAQDFNADLLLGMASNPDRMMNDSPFKSPTGGAFVYFTKAFAFAMGDQLKEKFSAMVDEQVGENGMSAEERDAQLEKIDAELTKLGREEEELIAGLEALGETVYRRPDADPAIILEVREVEDPEPEHNRPEPAPRSETSRDAEPTTNL